MKDGIVGRDHVVCSSCGTSVATWNDSETRFDWHEDKDDSDSIDDDNIRY